MSNIVFTGDWHIADLDTAKFVSKWLKDHLSAKTDKLILMGDLIDSGISRGMGWNQDSVNKQLIYLKKILERYTVIGYVLGNHERRIFEKTGLNPYQMLLGDEKTEYVTLNPKEAGINRVSIIAIEHGKSGAQNPVLELLKLAQIHPRADIVALGHNHELGIYMLPHGVIGLRTGTLQQYPDYARRFIMIPKTLGCIRYKPITNEFNMIY